MHDIPPIRAQDPNGRFADIEPRLRASLPGRSGKYGGRKLAPMLRQPIESLKRVVNLHQYFDALRASVPGLSARSKLRHRDIIEAIHARERARWAQT